MLFMMYDSTWLAQSLAGFAAMVAGFTIYGASALLSKLASSSASQTAP
jgi:hypothetical protein